MPSHYVGRRRYHAAEFDTLPLHVCTQKKRWAVGVLRPRAVLVLACTCSVVQRFSDSALWKHFRADALSISGLPKQSKEA